MEAVAIVVGLVLICSALIDVFMTVLYYDDVGFLSRRLYRGIWRILRVIGGRRANKPKILALGVPLMIGGTLVMWLGLIVLGFGSLYYVGLEHGHFSVGENLNVTLLTGFYLSAVSVSTLGYGDVTPITSLFKIATSLQALTGLTIIALGVSYVLNINQVVRQISVFGGQLRNETAGAAQPRSLLVPHFRQGEPRGLGDRLYQLHESLLSYYEGVRHYPIVYFFYSHRSHASTPYIFHTVGDVIAALRWGLPEDHPAALDPWLPTLVEDYLAITRHVCDRFDIEAEASKAQPVTYEEFEREFRDRFGQRDRWLTEFLELNGWMGDLAQTPTTGDPREAYGRYQRWLPFAQLKQRFVSGTGEDLGHLA
jgi:hypothetical protein